MNPPKISPFLHICPICGSKSKYESYLFSTKHITSEKHIKAQNNLPVDQITKEELKKYISWTKLADNIPMPPRIFNDINKTLANMTRSIYKSIIEVMEPLKTSLAILSNQMMDSWVKIFQSIEKSPWFQENKIILENNNRYIEELKQSYNKKQITLFIGAGISKSLGLPCWNEFIDHLYLKCSEKMGDRQTINEPSLFISENLKEIYGSDLLSGGDYIAETLGDDLASSIQSILYGDFKSEEDYESKIQENNLLNEIATLCKGIKGIIIITYNYDDMIERKLRQENINYHSFFQNPIEMSRLGVNILHVHGFIPYSGKNYSDRIFLAQKDYFRLYDDPNTWENDLQKFFFWTSTCVFIGISFKDPNLRRIAQLISNKNKTQRNPPRNHYIFLKNIMESGIGKTLQDMDMNKVLPFALDYYFFISKEFSQMGLNIINYKEYDEIPGILENITSEAED